jgi:hypothetical protein
MIKPFTVVKILLLLGLIWGLIFSLNTRNEIQLGSFTLKIPTLESIIKPQKFSVNTYPPSTNKSKNVNKANTKISGKFVVDSLEVDWIQHPPNNQNVLFSFYHKIKIEKSKDIIRILHFGDSQIEGDRISSVLREELQKIWGGSGTGFLPLSENNLGKPSAQIQLNNWQKHQWFNSKQNAPHNLYGFTGYFHQLQNTLNPGIFSVKTSGFALPKSLHFKNIKLLFNSKNQEFNCTVEQKNKASISQNSLATEEVQLLTIPFLSNLKQNVSFTLTGATNNIDFYGISLDSDTGITVDNIPMRGSSYINVSKANFKNLKHQLDYLNVGLIIYQFGINVVPNILSNYDFYEKMVFNELVLLKKLVPNAAILVIGISDMSYFTNEQYQSYPNLELIKQAQKNAAFANNCAFWDLQEVMGGTNSMVDWVNSQPPLAQPDHAHFSPAGAKIIGKKLAQAIEQDYKDYMSLQE